MQIGKFVKTISSTPVLNRYDFSSVFHKEGFLADEKGHIRALEFVALKDSFFFVKNELYDCDQKIYRVRNSNYPLKNLYIDHRFVQNCSYQKKKKILPPKRKILSFLEKTLTSYYIWGGNEANGCPELLEYYPTSSTLSKEEKIRRNLMGFDCSGLLYRAADGITPRNTSSLCRFGRFLDIQNQSVSAICKRIKPLDLILYDGHLLLALSDKEIIESREKKGVVLSPSSERLEELFQTKTPSENYKKGNYFFIKRWV